MAAAMEKPDMACPHCHSVKFYRKGKDRKPGKPPVQRYKCANRLCRKRFSETTAIMLKDGKVPLKEDAPIIATLEQLSTEEKQRREIASLKKQIKGLATEAVDTTRLRGLIHGMGEHDMEAPEWLVEPKGIGKYGTPTLFLSDLHWGEKVFPSQINYTNEFNLNIARKRLYRVFETTTRLLRDFLVDGVYDGIVLALGGDMLSGNIHDEIRETNDAHVLACLADLHDHLIAGIDVLAAEFGRVFVPCVVGNHGRLDRKPRAKGAVRDNFEWILYHFIAKHYESDPRVHVVVSESLDYIYKVHNTRYLLTHGDQFRGGSGISGPILPWSLGDHRKRKRQDAIDQPYDIMIFGHWHQLFWGGGTFICNGSLKGYDEYAFRNNFSFQPAMQALWITHPDHGITFQMPIFADKMEKRERAGWISILNQGGQSC